MKQKAVALRYREDMPAPFILAKGRAGIAERMLMIAEKHGIGICSEPELTERLFILEPDSFIPEECFEVVARLLTYVHSVHTRREKGLE